MLDKLERKLGRFAIRGLMKYVVIVYALGLFIDMINPEFYYTWLMLDIDKLLKGQIWRLITFILQPIESGFLLSALMMYVYYSIGITLEQVWGTFRFNLFYFMGIISNILAVVFIYIVTYLIFGTGISFPVSLSKLNMSMLLAFGITFPETRFLLMLLIPVKAKWLVAGYLIIFAFDIIKAFASGGLFYGLCTAAVILISMANFFVYFLMTKRSVVSPVQIKRRVDFKRSYAQGTRGGYTSSVVDDKSGGTRTVITRHKCAVCGRTELDGDNLEFRFCSKCNGNYEYCQDHLFTHEHVK